DHPKVKNYSFFTNFTLANKEIIDQILNTKKLHEFFISIYGHDEEAFIKFTQSNSKTYQRLISNLEYLLKKVENIKIHFQLSFGLRTYQSFDSLKACSSELCQLIKKLAIKTSKHIIINKKYYNWGGYISEEDVKGLDIYIKKAADYYKKGACSLIFYKNQVMADGRINACACRDVDATLAIGDINNQSFKEIYSVENKIYMNIIRNQQLGKFNLVCESCDFYRSIYKNYDVYDKYKKESLTLKKFLQSIK
ncbi:MAG: hypothetical protein GF353_29325, partial [Candidatus Lokiarchaeota archaeon]|nr:hypothetical protein [Candidatus Lokiarchaeota archaeon]